MPDCIICEKAKTYVSSQGICEFCLSRITENDRQNITVDGVMVFLKIMCGSDSPIPSEILNSGDIEEAIIHRIPVETTHDMVKRLYVEHMRESAGMNGTACLSVLLLTLKLTNRRLKKNNV